jgi:hypothetical protein
MPVLLVLAAYSAAWCFIVHAPYQTHLHGGLLGTLQLLLHLAHSHRFCVRLAHGYYAPARTLLSLALERTR